MKLISDYKWRNFLTADEVPAKALNDFAHLNDDERLDHFLKYEGAYYHISDFQAFDGTPFDGFYAANAFCLIVIKLRANGEQYRIGKLLS